jgi:uncharacterized membrane protein YhiD involved in acid resistance
MVSLGSCLFSICSAFAFLNGPMAWDASRVSAAIPSGVGFLGSALIFKSQIPNSSGGSTGMPAVHGLTTAASVWLSAAVGIGCGGGLYFVSSFCTAIMLVVLRFGPRSALEDPSTEMMRHSHHALSYGSTTPVPISNNDTNTGSNTSTPAKRDGEMEGDPESQSLVNHKDLRDSIRHRPQLL